MTSPPYLRSRLRRGRWFHTYRRGDKEISLKAHGLHPTDPRVFAAYCAEHVRWEEKAASATAPKGGTFAWAVDLYQASDGWKTKLEASTKQNREAIYRRYLKAQGDRPLATITRDDLEAALLAKGGHAAANELKALKPVFAFVHRLKLIPTNPAAGLKLDRPGGEGFPTADAEDIERFQQRWQIGTTERLAFDLAILTGAARADLVKLSRRNIDDDLLSFKRQKTGIKAVVPIRTELRAVIDRTPDIAPAFLLTSYGRPFTAAGLGNLFADAARSAGMVARLHGLRKAFCVYWAEEGASTNQIAAMAGHLSLTEVARYTRAADKERIVRALVQSK